jgi:hypothetical protein
MPSGLSGYGHPISFEHYTENAEWKLYAGDAYASSFNVSNRVEEWISVGYDSNLLGPGKLNPNVLPGDGEGMNFKASDYYDFFNF